MTQQPTASTSNSNSNSNNSGVLYPQLESSIEDLDENDKYKEIVRIEKELVANFRLIATAAKLVEDVSDHKIFPVELTTLSTRKLKTRSKEDVIKKISELPTEDAEDEEQQQQEDEDESDEEQEMAPDEEEDEAGGDYIMSHFDNGEGFEDNDDGDDDGTGVI